jgi:hypothetical protein
MLKSILQQFQTPDISCSECWTGGNQYALKAICGEHAAWHAEILARRLFADPAVPRIAYSGRHNADVDYAFMEWVDGGSLAELLAKPNHPTVPVVFARAGAPLVQIHSLDEPQDRHNMAKRQRPRAASGGLISSTISSLTCGSYPTDLGVNSPYEFEKRCGRLQLLSRRIEGSRLPTAISNPRT